jgi:hypothetical protein
LYRRLAFGRHKALPGLVSGLTLHAAVRVEAHDRKRLEQLCRCITRPALWDEPVQVNAAWPVELKLKTPWRDGLAGRARPLAGPFARASAPWQPVIQKILTYLGLQARVPPRAPARGQALQAA